MNMTAYITRVFFACFAIAAQAEITPIKVGQTEWDGGAAVKDVQAVVDSVAKTFLRHGGVATAEAVLVYQTADTPIALWAPAPGGERVVKLATRGPYWCQIAYQFAHEYCHVFTRHWTVSHGHRNMWFAESLCELASLWCLCRMGDDWLAGDTPYANWQSYGQSLKKYVGDHTKDVPTFGDADAFAAWLKANLDSLHKDHTNRAFNTVVAVRLLPLFRETPGLWQAVSHLNADVNADDAFQTHLQRWHDAAPADLRPAVTRIAAELGFPLKQG